MPSWKKSRFFGNFVVLLTASTVDRIRPIRRKLHNTILQKEKALERAGINFVG
jgi:hypothetical protein